MFRSILDFGRWLWGSKTPPFRHLQVEVTSRCNLPGCVMCPRCAFPERWLNQDLAWQDFERLIPALRLFRNVHLSGWGEPLLHPRLWDMAKAARRQGCTVGLTTNGMALTEAAQELAQEHLDLVAVSLDGASAATYEALRPGADFPRVTRQVAALCAGKRALGRERPEVALLFMKMRPNIAELPALVELAASLGVDRVNATNLDFTPDRAVAGLSLIAPGSPSPEITDALQRAGQRARELNLPFRDLSLNLADDLLVCDANPLDNVLVTASGRLAPCVYLGLPVAGDFSRLFMQRSRPAQNYFYGSIRDLDFQEIRQQPAYQDFTAVFRRRLRGKVNLMDCVASYGRTSTPKAPPVLERFPWPPACQGCYKTLGL